MIIPDRLLDDWGRRVVRGAIEAASRTSSLVYLVGGPVRDLAMGVPTHDLDLAVERNEDAFAEELAELLSASLLSTERFLTWRLTTPAKHHVDLARIRTETYPHPGALPVVSAASSIQEDLSRRDFTVNAMAIRLNDGLLVDPCSGRADLDERLIRVLHEVSFRDDPTRVFRALRLARRCGFSIEPATSTLLDEAVAEGALETVSRERIWKEVRIATEERAPIPALRAFVERGCLVPILGPLDSDGLARLSDSLEIPTSLDSTVLLLGALCRGCRDGQFETLPFNLPTISRIRTISERNPSLADLLVQIQAPDQQFAVCETASREERFLAAAERQAISEIVARFDEALEITRSIRGDGLGVAPGPCVGRALRETRRGIFAGEVDAEDAPAFARQLAMKYLND